MRIKRTKTGPSGPDGQPSTPAVAWVKAVDVTGNVTLWVKDEAVAADFDEAAVARVRAQYADRPMAGLIEFVGEDDARRRLREELEQHGKTHQSWLSAPESARIAALQEELTAEQARGQKAVAELAAERAASQKGTDSLQALSTENAALKVEVAGLKDRLAALQKEPAPPHHPAAAPPTHHPAHAPTPHPAPSHPTPEQKPPRGGRPKSEET